MRPGFTWCVAVVVAVACSESAANPSERDASAGDAGTLRCEDPPPRDMPPGDAADDARGAGRLFQSIDVPGFTDVIEDTKGTALVDVDHDGRLDIVVVHAKSAQVLLNDGCFGFTAGSSLPVRPRAQVPNLIDFNADGWLDLFITHNRGAEAAADPGNSLLLSAAGLLDFEDVSKGLGVRNAEAYSRQSSIADIDGDGWLDIAVGADNIGDMVRLGRPRQRLYRFEPAGDRFEDGRFVDLGGTDVIPGFGGEVVCDPDIDRSSPGITLRDLDDDGDLDLVQAYHVDMSQADWNSPCASGEYWQGMYVWRNLLREEGALRFEPVTSGGLPFSGRMQYDEKKAYYVPDEAHPDAVGLPYVSMADVNNDGLLDVLAVGPSDPQWQVQAGMDTGRFWYNRGDFRFDEATEEAGLGELNWSYRQWDALWDTGTVDEVDRVSPGFCPPWSQQKPLCTSLPFLDMHPYAGDAVFADFDNDGWVDLVFVDRRETPVLPENLRNVLFLNQGDGTFRAMPSTWSGIDSNSMAAGVGDLNGDGLLELVLVKSPSNSTGGLWAIDPQRKRDVVYWNTGAHGARANHWLRFRFSGIDDRHLAGAKIVLRDVKSHALIGMRTIFSNHSYKSGDALEAHFGLGTRVTADAEVTLPDGRTLEFSAIAADHFWDLDLDTSKRRSLSASRRTR